MVTRERIYTVQEFAALLEEQPDTSLRLELIEGSVVEMPKPTGQHGEITGNIFGFIWNYAREHKLGRVTAAETGFILGANTVRGLDVAFISAKRSPDPLPAELVTIAPDLAVEVISPGNTASDINRKIHELFAAETSLIWIVYPETRTVDVHQSGSATTLTESGTLDGGTVLPGFTLPVSQIFP